MMLAAGQFLPESQEWKGRFSMMVILFIGMAALFAWFGFTLIVSMFKGGVKGEYGGRQPDRATLAKLWLDWLQHAQDLPNEEIVNVVFSMNSFDRQKIHYVVHCWNAVTGDGYSGDRHTRLERIPSRSKVQRDQVAQVSRKSS